MNYSFLNKKFFSYITYIIFLIYFFCGLAIHKDFGISIDEPFHRTVGYYWYLWILNNFFPGIENLENLNSYFAQMEWSGEMNKGLFLQYGPFFDFFSAFLEDVLNIGDLYNVYHFRHLLNFILFFISTIFFYKIIDNRFNNQLISLLGFLFYISSPRIFAESFYNSKDITFLSLMIISTYFLIKLLRNFEIKNIIIFCLVAGMSTAVRPMGILLWIVFLFFFTIDCIDTKNYLKKNLNAVIGVSILYFLFTFIFWPYLWSDPINNFLYSFNSFKNYNWDGSIFYFGEYIKASNSPWHYTLVWIFITTPVIYTILLIIGFFKIFNIFLNNLIKLESTTPQKFFNNLKEKEDMFFVSLFLGPLIAVIFFNSTLYGSWRHLYFIYPAMIYLIIFGTHLLLNKIKKKIYKNLFLSLIIITILINIFNISKLHPYQNIYFNFFVEKKANKLFEVDYWGLANAGSINFILNNYSNKEKINLGVSSFTPLNYSRYIIEDKNLNKINFVGTAKKEADFIFTNYYYERNPKFLKKYNVPKNFEKIYTLKKGNVVINEIFKKKDK